MFNIHDNGTSLCDGLTRREWLRIGGLGLGGLALPVLLQAQKASAMPTRPRGTGRANSCIVLFFLGGPPQHETWDPKPDAPAEVRGDLRPIASAVPGMTVGELMPKVARWTDKIAVLRGVCTNDNSHSSSGYYMSTGHAHQPPGVEHAKPGPPNDWPCLGGLVQRFRPQLPNLSAAVTLPEHSADDNDPHPWPGQDAGFMGRRSDPMFFNTAGASFQNSGLALPRDISPLRLDERRSLLTQINRHIDAISASEGLSQHDAMTQQAFDLLSSGQARRAFDLNQEPLSVRERYGQYAFGQSVLMARRLVESGVSLIRVNWTRVPGALNAGHWDTHSRNTAGLKQLMPLMDQTYSALLEDLSVRGLLDETLVVWMGEFGRTPRLNGSGGRDHWGRVFSVALAGGGIRGGVIHGASDSIGGSPRDGRVVPQDLLATILHCLGIAPDSEFTDRLGRPIPAMRGDVIQQVI